MLKELDQNLLDLAWSLWTELGVAGVKQNHQDVLIWIEELILFTSALSSVDPRLRDESMDWCLEFHHLISIHRLNSLKKDFEPWIRESFSQYAATINVKLSKPLWKPFVELPPFVIHQSHKSILRPHASAALLNIRARSIFTVGSRADLITFFLTHPNTNFSVAEVAEIGYSKRNLAEVLDDLHFGNLFDRFMQGNQQRYRLKAHSPLLQMLQPIPKFAPSWHLIFKLILILRACIQRTQKLPTSSIVIEIRNCLKEREGLLQKLGIPPPPAFQHDLSSYLKDFSDWLLGWTNPVNVYRSSSR